MAKTIDIVGFNTEPNSGYDHDSLTQDLRTIETDSQELALEIIETISTAAKDGEPVALAGGHGYERKSFLSVDALGGQRNSSYGSKEDDVLLQLTVRVSYAKAEGIVAALAEERIAREERAAQEKREAIDAEIARLQAERAAL